jgi:hypothetical protein
MKHPTVEIPNIGPMDHAWDILGEWAIDLEVPLSKDSISGILTVHSWMEAELTLEPWGAAAAGLPQSVVLERASRVHLTDAGGGALQWVLLAPDDNWTVQATLWPGSLCLFVQKGDNAEDQLFRATGNRSRDYYLAKYPLVTS